MDFQSAKNEIWPKMSEKLESNDAVLLLERLKRQAWSKQTNIVGTHWVLAEAGHDYRPQLLLRLEQQFGGKESHGQSMECDQAKSKAGYHSPLWRPLSEKRPNPTNDLSKTGKLPQYPCLPQFISPLRVGHILSLPFFLS